ncbi:DEAD/DEAH box helicase [Acinetobacter sp. ANC 5414]|uniref:DEAD/DEAH box helicase n=1 Tax=Acinetobacter sp. ANC 5414 TaxID=2731251 RepID=UPI00148F57CF|nr:DEAD/DEAH box helicase [Acinetobacter sp. ANC 5414]NNH01891.1 DEAD/DEAH box helicase [Acinetobacter sp. ANC 5414]
MNNESIDQLIEQHLEPGYRGRLLDRGLSRSMIWHDGLLPENAPHYSEDLSYDLLSYGYSLLSLAIKSIETNGNLDLRLKAFEKAATALMVVVNGGDKNYTQRAFHILLSASAYHLAHYSAKAYSLLKKYEYLSNSNILENALRLLITRNLKKLNQSIPIWKIEIKKKLDEFVDIESRSTIEELDDISANFNFINLVLTERYLEVLYDFLNALETGDARIIDRIEENLVKNISISLEYNFLEEWWIFRITKYLLRDLWYQTYHYILPKNNDDVNWNHFRLKFIKNLLKKKNAEIDLWPSQIEGAKRAINDSENLIISLPTSAGKTRIAELCILRALSQSKKVMFITPLRALSVQTEMTLSSTFSNLGIKVSSLYGGLGLYGFQKNQFEDSNILIGTPEKLEFVLKNDPELLQEIGLVILDEGHMLGLGEREIKFETLVQNLLNRPDAYSRRIVCLSAILPSGTDLDDFVDWLGYPSEGKAITSEWRPTDLRFGEIYINNDLNSYRLDFTLGTHNPFIPIFIQKKSVSSRSQFPNKIQDLSLSIAHKYVNDGQSILIYCPEKKSVNILAKRIIDINRQGHLCLDLGEIKSDFYTAALNQGKELLGPTHPVILCLTLGIIIHHGSLPKEYRTAVELLLKNTRVNLIISSPTLAQGLNLQANVVLFYSIYRFGRPIPASEFRNVIGRAGRSFVDLQGIVLFPNCKNERKKTAQWNSLILNKDNMSLNSGLGMLVLELINRVTISLGEENIHEIYEYIINSNYIFDFPEVHNESEDEIVKAQQQWKKYLGLLDCSIINLIGIEDIAIEEIAEYIDVLLRNSFFYKQISRLSSSEQLLFKGLIEKRAEYLWNTTTIESRQQVYFSGVSLETINDSQGVIENIFSLIGEVQIELTLDDSNNKIISSLLIQIAENIFYIHEFSPKSFPENWKNILDDWLNGRNYLIIDNTDIVIDFIEKYVAYNLIWAIEFFKIRYNRGVDNNIEQNTFDYISQVFDYGCLNKNALFLMQLGLKSRKQAYEIAEYLNFSDIGSLVKWLKQTNLHRNINILGEKNTKSLIDLSMGIGRDQIDLISKCLDDLIVTWSIDDPLDYIFTNIKLVNIDKTTYILSSTAEIIGKLQLHLNLDLMDIIHLYIQENHKLDIFFQCLEYDDVVMIG